MDRKQAIEFAIRSARMGVDQEQVEDYRDNVRDTLNDEGGAEWDQIADNAFCAEVERLTGKAGDDDAEWESYQDDLEAEAWDRECSSMKSSEAAAIGYRAFLADDSHLLEPRI